MFWELFCTVDRSQRLFPNENPKTSFCIQVELIVWNQCHIKFSRRWILALLMQERKIINQKLSSHFHCLLNYSIQNCLFNDLLIVRFTGWEEYLRTRNAANKVREHQNCCSCVQLLHSRKVIIPFIDLLHWRNMCFMLVLLQLLNPSTVRTHEFLYFRRHFATSVLRFVLRTVGLE